MDKNWPDSKELRATSTNSARLHELMQKPAHKPTVDKFKNTGVRTFAPLTMEDKGQFGNLGLIKSLRADRDRNNAHNISRTSKGADADKHDVDPDEQEEKQ